MPAIFGLNHVYGFDEYDAELICGDRNVGYVWEKLHDPIKREYDSSSQYLVTVALRSNEIMKA